jgi:hypothetical protein
MFYRVGSISGWVVAVFERGNRFPEATAKAVAKNLQKAAGEVGELVLHVLGFLLVRY